MRTTQDHIPSMTRVAVTQHATAEMLKMHFAYAVVIICALTQGFASTNTVSLLVGSGFNILVCSIHSYNITLFRYRTTIQMIKMSFIGLLMVVAFFFNMYLTHLLQFEKCRC